MHLYTADGWTGDIIECNEGTLEWVDNARIPDLPAWAGDRIFLRLIAEDAPFFSLKLEYTGEALTAAVLDGTALDV
jgi:8-oxo-dGTP diphosphatase